MILRDMQGEESTAAAKGLVQRVLGVLRRQPHGPPTAATGGGTDVRRTHEQVMESVSRLAGGIAHDLNNILLVVQGYTEMALAEKDAGAETRTHLAEVRDAAARASALVGDLLIVGRRSPLAPRLVDLNDTLSRLMPELESQAGGNIEVTLAPAADLPLVMADEEQLKRLALVLCVRARDAMAGGGRIALQTLTVSRGKERHVHLRISDTGPRIPEEMRLQMFEPYFPGPVGGKGYGLRLSLVHGIVKRFGGNIEIEQGGEAGTTFVVVLPALPATHEGRPAPAPPRQEERAPESAAGPRGGGDGRTILLAEDDEGLRVLATKILSHEGFTILAARDGQEAVEIFERHRDVIRLALLDDVMPRMGGRAALARMRQLVPGLPAIVCSGYTWSLGGNARESGEACMILAKPWQPRELLRRVREGLEEG
jgi:two-component system cell cycle sensor histidine kinase/response regulator CckA